MRIRRVEIERVVLDGAAMSADGAERFRVALAEELARLLGEDFDGAGVRSTGSLRHLSIDGVGSPAADDRANARIVAQSVVQALACR